MKKSSLAICAILLFIAPVFGQYATVNYDYELNRFGENEPLPAEKSVLFTGNIPGYVDYVEIKIFTSKGKNGREALAAGNWKRPFDKTGNSFNVPVNYKLRGSSKYDLSIGFYQKIDTEEKQAVYDQMTVNLGAYLNQTFGIKKNGIKLTRNTRQVMADMDEIVNAGLTMYRSRTTTGFGGFSDIVRQKIEAIGKADLSKAQYIFTTGEKDEQRKAYRDLLTEELKQLVFSEVKFLLNHEMTRLIDSRFIDDYETEERSTHFALNAGYGGVWLNGKLDDKGSFGNSPYFGLGFPLSTSSIAPKFFQDASLTFGFFTNNFENKNGTKISGPIFNRPLYAGLDYKLFSFVRFNAGATILEEQGGDDGSDKIFFRPFIGISAKVNISLGLDK